MSYKQSQKLLAWHSQVSALEKCIFHPVLSISSFYMEKKIGYNFFHSEDKNQ